MRTMRTDFHRGAALLLALLFWLSAVSVAAGESGAEDPSPEEEKNLQYLVEEYKRFGSYTEVTRDEAGNVTLVNGYPTHRVRGAINSIGSAETLQFETDFVDYPFWQPSTEYDGNLAVMSLVMALSADRAKGFSDTEASFDPSLNVQAFLKDAGFQDIRKDDYSRVPTMFTVSSAMGHRVMTAEGQEPFTLIAVGVCGGGYRNEWMSNLTPGEGKYHEGFKNAAQLVVDRLSGYILTHGIQGRIKVWISGFSRAAAVSNLTAGMLNETGAFAKEDIYAYTFATPAAVMNPPATGYENIYNIVNPMDLVPQVMPAEWEFGRYGTTLYLPVEEFTDLIGTIYQSDRAEISADAFGAVSNYSPELSLRVRLLTGLILDLVQDRVTYNRQYQPVLVGIMGEKTVPNILTMIRRLMAGLAGSSRADRTNLDQTLDYVMRVFRNTLLRVGLGEANQNAGSFMVRMLGEHGENAYLGNETAIRESVFEGTDSFYYLMVKGPVSLEVWEPAEEQASFVLEKDGTLRTSESWQEFLEGTGIRTVPMYLERIENTSIAAVPADSNYRVVWKAEAGGETESLLVKVEARAYSDFTVLRSGKRTIQAGESGVVWSGPLEHASVPEGFSQHSMNARSIAEFIGIASLGINWRIALMLLYALIGLAVCVLICLAASRTVRRRKQYRFPVWALLCVYGIAALEAEVAYWFFADQNSLRLIWKVVGAVSLMLIHFLARPEKARMPQPLTLSLGIGLIADAVTGVHFVTGVALFLVFHLSLAIQFIRIAPMQRKRWILWGVISVLVMGGIAFFHARENGLIGWVVVGYVPVLLLTAFSAIQQRSRLRLAAVLLLISDTMLGLFFSVMPDPALHGTYMLLFAVAMLMLALSHSKTRGKMNSAPRQTQAS